LLPAGHTIGRQELLFEKIEDEIIQKQRDKLVREEKNTSMKTEPIKSPATFDDFQKMDIRTATILEAEKVPKTKKLLKLLLDTGVDKRIVVSGIAEYHEPEKIIGKKVCLLANLEPRTIKGIESKGMILMAEDSDGRLVFVQPGDEIANGCTIR
jgi:methionyl-tRNA synthetase